MFFSGIELTSSIDFPGHLATVLFASGCNYRCEYCYNLDKIDTKAFSGEEILPRLLKRKKYITSVVISGGEPTIQPDLPLWLETLREHEFEIKLDTNGSNPQMIKELLKRKLLTYIAMDLKSPVQYYRSVTCCSSNQKALLQSIRLIKESEISHEFRTTVLPGFSAQTLLKTAWPAYGAARYALQPFYPFKKKYTHPSLKGPATVANVINSTVPELKEHFGEVLIRGQEALTAHA